MMQRDEKENRGVQPKTAETHGETLFWGCHRHREKSFRNETCNVITNSMVLILDGNSEIGAHVKKTYFPSYAHKIT